ncbi:hypothetical protein EPUL_004813 [Erysiphe pulchra]|uniref:Ubiquitin thioesterase OTU n=1 Tax=Erysiphe pulchra TaxID=225359 RepID=A0A2S4PNB0_9PEZI|nr:hypothetical protein EPUL_004813 [Erysiphe pulchra]
MRLRVRGPKGASTLTLPEEATLADLIENISTFTGLSNFNLKYGYPPKSLNLDQKDLSQKITEFDVKIEGEQLTVCPNSSDTTEQADSNTNSNQQSNNVRVGNRSGISALTKPLESFASPFNPVSTNGEKEDEVPEVLMLHRGAKVGNCLFRAFGSAVLPGDDKSMPELRSLVASVIQIEPETYTKAVLEKSPDDYCRWIQSPNAWGGAIELGILAKHFDIEICSIDVETLRIDRFNEGRENRCILVYSGIHYDTIALSPVDTQHYNFQSPPELDQRVWESQDSEILETAVELCRILQAKHYYTNTVKMRIKCKSCGKIIYGEKEAAKHAQQSGHYDMEQL